MPIFKLQRPISPPNGGWLIHDKGKKHMAMLPARSIGDDVRAAMGSDMKAYFEGKLLPDGRFEILGRAPDQDW